MVEKGLPQPSPKERLHTTARVVFDAANRGVEKVAGQLDTLSRVRLIVKPTDREVRERRKEKFDAIVPYLQNVPIRVVELLLDHDKMPQVDKYGKKYPSQYELRKHRIRKDADFAKRLNLIHQQLDDE